MRINSAFGICSSSAFLILNISCIILASVSRGQAPEKHFSRVARLPFGSKPAADTNSQAILSQTSRLDDFAGNIWRYAKVFEYLTKITTDIRGKIKSGQNLYDGILKEFSYEFQKYSHQFERLNQLLAQYDPQELMNGVDPEFQYRFAQQHEQSLSSSKNKDALRPIVNAVHQIQSENSKAWIRKCRALAENAQRGLDEIVNTVFGVFVEFPKLERNQLDYVDRLQHIFTTNMGYLSTQALTLYRIIASRNKCYRKNSPTAGVVHNVFNERPA